MPARSRRLDGVHLTFAIILSILVAACSSGATTTAPSASLALVSPSPIAAPTTSATPAPSPAAFPVSLTDDEGTTVDIESLPQKIISLTPAATETLFALGAGDRVVASDDASDYPDGATSLTHVATFNKVDVEKVVALEPDLVIAGGLEGTPADAITKLRTLNVPVLVIYAASVDGVYKDIELLGTATGTSETATALIDSMRKDMEAVAAAANAAGTKPRVYYEVGYDDATGAIYAPADDSFVADMVTLAGADTITTGDPNSYQIPLEKLIQADPQLILIGTNPFYSPTPSSLMQRAGWSAMTAVKDKAVKSVRDIEITRPGPRLPIGLRTLVSAIWPDVSLPPAP
jgi:iron complex transport system substrate-binding protein